MQEEYSEAQVRQIATKLVLRILENMHLISTGKRMWRQVQVDSKTQAKALIEKLERSVPAIESLWIALHGEHTRLSIHYHYEKRGDKWAVTMAIG